MTEKFVLESPPRCGTETSIDNIGKQILRGRLVSERGVPGDGHNGDDLVDDAAEVGIDGTLCLLRRWNGAGVAEGAEGVDDGGAVGDGILAGDSLAAGEGGVTSGFWFELGEVELIKGQVTVTNSVIGNTKGNKVIKEGLDKSSEFSYNLTNADNKVDFGGKAEDYIIDVKANVNLRNAIVIVNF